MPWVGFKQKRFLFQLTALKLVAAGNEEKSWFVKLVFWAKTSNFRFCWECWRSLHVALQRERMNEEQQLDILQTATYECYVLIGTQGCRTGQPLIKQDSPCSTFRMIKQRQ